MTQPFTSVISGALRATCVVGALSASFTDQVAGGGVALGSGPLDLCALAKEPTAALGQDLPLSSLF